MISEKRAVSGKAAAVLLELGLLGCEVAKLREAGRNQHSQI